MEDRYLYKAKRIDNGEWVEGALFDGEKYCVIGQQIKFSPYIENECKIVGYMVDPSTICKCTGLKDKSGKFIWENDVVKDSRGNLYKVFWQENYYQFAFICIKANDALLLGAQWDLWSLAKYKDLELHGNIFDNPELLEVEE